MTSSKEHHFSLRSLPPHPAEQQDPTTPAKRDLYKWASSWWVSSQNLRVTEMVDFLLVPLQYHEGSTSSRSSHLSFCAFTDPRTVLYEARRLNLEAAFMSACADTDLKVRKAGSISSSEEGFPSCPVDSVFFPPFCWGRVSL